jgi:hypothetical protein
MPQYCLEISGLCTGLIDSSDDISISQYNYYEYCFLSDFAEGAEYTSYAEKAQLIAIEEAHMIPLLSDRFIEGLRCQSLKASLASTADLMRSDTVADAAVTVRSCTTRWTRRSARYRSIYRTSSHCEQAQPIPHGFHQTRSKMFLLR